MRPARYPIVFAAVLGFLCAAGESRQMDAGNTQVAFQINRLGLRWFTAVFHELTGDFVLDPDGRGGHLSVVVRMASIDCRSAFWDDRLRSPQWFDIAKYPEMIYRSSRIDFDGATRAAVHGDLTLHGITRPVTLNVTDIECPPLVAGTPHTCRFVGHAQLKRSDFGLAHAFWQGGDFVEIIVRGI